MARLGVAYLSMASSFSSSSFCRSITAMIMFLSSSVRWLRSGSSCMGGGTVGGRGPRGPTAEDILVACPPPPPALGLSPFGFTPSSCAPASPHSGALLAAAAGGGAAAAAAAEPGRERTQSFMVVCNPPSPGCCLCFGRPGEARGCPAASRSPASAGGGGQAEARRARRARRGGEGSRQARPIRASRAGRAGRGRGRGRGWGRRRRRRGCSLAQLRPVWGCGREMESLGVC